MKKLSLITVLTFLLIFTACSEDNTPSEPLGDYENGYFVTNEGPFQNGSGTITFVGDDGSVSQQVYKTLNGEDLGNIVNSMYVEGDKAYIVVNNSHKIVVVNRFTMEKVATIEGDDINNPRYFVARDGIGYVSNWGDPFITTDDFVSVINLESNTVVDRVSVGEGPEKMIVNGNNLFVCLQGGYGNNNKVFVIDLNQNSINTSIRVSDVPNSITVDGNGQIRVLCGGSPSWTGAETAGSLYSINPATFETENIDFTLTDHPSLLNYDMGRLYYNLNGKMYEMDIEASDLPNSALNGLDGFYYAAQVKNGEFFGTDAGDFASEGTLKVFSISSGSLLETNTTGIVPGNIVFP